MDNEADLKIRVEIKSVLATLIFDYSAQLRNSDVDKEWGLIGLPLDGSNTELRLNEQPSKECTTSELISSLKLQLNQVNGSEPKFKCN